MRAAADPPTIYRRVASRQMVEPLASDGGEEFATGRNIKNLKLLGVARDGFEHTDRPISFTTVASLCQ